MNETQEPDIRESHQEQHRYGQDDSFELAVHNEQDGKDGFAN